MRITYKADYALKAVLDLAMHYGQGVVSIRDMANRIDAPVKFLEQVLFDLRKAGLIESRRGNEGGYLLAKAPREISVGEVIRLIEGSLEPISCVKQGYSDCGDIHKCVFKKIWRDVYQATSSIIDNVTFEELSNQVESTQKVFVYSI